MATLSLLVVLLFGLQPRAVYFETTQSWNESFWDSLLLLERFPVDLIVRTDLVYRPIPTSADLLFYTPRKAANFSVGLYGSLFDSNGDLADLVVYDYTPQPLARSPDWHVVDCSPSRSASRRARHRLLADEWPMRPVKWDLRAWEQVDI